MIATVLLTMIIAGIATLPGLLSMRGAKAQIGQLSAAATASLVCMMLVTALLGRLFQFLGMGGLPAAALVAVSTAIALVAWWRTRGRRWASEPFEWLGAALAAAFVTFGLLTQFLAVQEDSSGALLIHAWYNADWFKHLGHVAALSNYGVPAADIFNNGEPLHYYWLSYVLPGAGASLGGSNWAALNAANALIVALFCMTYFATVRLAAPGPTPAFIAAFLGLIVCAPLGMMGYLFSGVESLLDFPSAPKAPALITMSQYLPQHALAIAALLSWIVLNRPDAPAPKLVRLLSLLALASVMTLSTLLGAVALGIYGLVALSERKLAALPEVIAMALLSVLLVFALGVLQIANPASAIESPLLINSPIPLPWYERAMTTFVLVVGSLGLPLLLSLFFVRYWRPGEAPAAFARHTALILISVAIVAAVGAQLALAPRLAIETRIRSVNLAAIGIAMVGAWAIAHWWNKGRKSRYATVMLLCVITLAALPSAIMRTLWHWQLGDGFTTVIPKDDRIAMAYLKDNSGPRATVWQFPEPPVLAADSGHDAWAAVLGGRTVPNSLRATDFAKARPYIELSRRYFRGDDVPVPGNMDWVYLSRALHPESYDGLVARLHSDPVWQRRACLQDACLFSRVTAATR